MLLLRNFFVGFSLLCMTACGFEPMYAAKSSSGYVGLHHIAVSDFSKTRESVMLKSKVEDLFYRDSASAFSTEKPYDLDMSLVINKKATIVDTDGEIQRFRMTIDSPYSLKRKTDGSEITSGTIKRIASYNTSDDNYAEYISSEDLITKAVAEIAEEYALRMGSKLATYQKGR